MACLDRKDLIVTLGLKKSPSDMIWLVAAPIKLSSNAKMADDKLTSFREELSVYMTNID